MATGEVGGLESGLRVGRYVIATRIGSGGMGVVYSAYDPQLDRKVAIKVLRPGGAGSTDASDGKTRLLREAQAMAKLAHPGVVAVYDVGEHRDRVYMAMELIDGQTLGSWLAEDERTVEEIVSVFVDAGRGLAAAHQAGLVHRDFKPDNVLVDRADRVRVMDFGLVRAARRYMSWTPDAWQSASPLHPTCSQDVLDSPLTQDGVVVGTPAYMAPEQHVGQEPTAASDQYSFCAALYEALHGQRPFRCKDLRELALAKARMQLAVLPGDAPPVPVALREVLVRGLQPHPGGRHPSMEYLLDAIEQSIARPKRRGWKWGAMGLGVVGLSAWGWLGVDDSSGCDPADKLDGVWSAEVADRTRDALERAHAELPNGTWSRVENGLDTYARQWEASYRLACEADPGAAHKDARLRCLQRRRAALAAAVGQLGQADQIRAERIVPMVMGLPAVVSCDEADGSAGGAYEDPELVVRAEALQVEYTTVRTLQLAGRYDEALQAGHDLLTRVVDFGHQSLEARTRLTIATLEHIAGNIDEAEEQRKRAFWVASGAGDDEMMVWAASSLVFFMSTDRADVDAAMEWARHAETALQRWNEPETFDFQRARADLDGSLAVAYSNTGAYEEALERFERNYRAKGDLLGPEHPEVAVALMNVGICLATIGRPQQAQDRLEHSLALFEKALGTDHPDLALNLSHLGSVHSELGHGERSKAYNERALAIYRSAYGEAHPAVASLLDSLGISEGQQGNFTAAMAYHRRALELYEASLGPEHPSVGRALLNMGLAAGAQHHFDEAKRYFERARGILRRTLGPDHDLSISASVELGLVLVDLEQYERAQALLEESLAAQRQAVGDEHPLVAQALSSLGWAYSQQERHALAKQQHEQALAIFEATYGPGHRSVLHTRFDVAMMDYRLGHAQRAAIQMEAILGDIDEQALEPAFVADVKFHLAEATLDSGGDRDKAMALAKQARDGFVLSGETGAEELPDVEAFLRGQRGKGRASAHP